MSIQTNCPNCDASYTLAESQRGKKVRCRKCSDAFVVGEENGARATQVGAGKSGKIRKDGLQTSQRPPAKTPPPKTKPAVRRDKDRDRDDDEEDLGREPVVKKKSGSAMPMILMIGGGLLLLFILCGGAAMVGVFWWTSSAVTNGLDNITQNIQTNGPGDPNDPFAPNGANPFGQPGFVPADNSQPKDVGEALDWVRNGQTAAKRNIAADWLARSAVDDARQKEVATALKVMVSNPNTHDPGLRALAVWAGPDDVPALIKAVEAGGAGSGEAADALVRLQDERAAPVFARKLQGFERGDAARRLAQLGPIAEKEVLKYMDDKEAGGEAVKLLLVYGTKPEIMFNQAFADLKNPISGYRRGACEYLSKLKVDEARRDEVSQALEAPLGDSDSETRKEAAVALKTWGTKANIESLVREVDSKDAFSPLFQPCVDALVMLKDERGAKAIAKHLTNIFQREAAARALRDMGPVAARAVAGYANNTDSWVRDQATSMMKSFGAKADLVFDAAVEDLDAADAGQRKAACEYLADKQPLNEAQQKQVARALDKMLADADFFNGVRGAAAKAEVNWGDKDSVPALIKAIKKENSDIWEPCMEALARIKDEKSVIPLLAETTKGKPHIEQAVKTLNLMGPVVETGLDNALGDPVATPADKQAICGYLGLALGTKTSLPALQMAAMDPVPAVKTAANAAIAAIKKRNP